MSSEDTGAYGRDLGTSLPALLRQLVAVLPPDGRCMLRVGMVRAEVLRTLQITAVVVCGGI